MRCRNCGWDNSENNAKCEKCNAPLDGSMMYEHQPETRQNHTEDNLFKKTRFERVPFQSQEEDKNTCPNCGYPVMPNTQCCPSCNTPLKQIEKPKEARHTRTQNFQLTDVLICPKCQCKNPADALFCSNCGSKLSAKATINPWGNVEDASACSLETLLPGNEESIGNKLYFSGEEIVLSRNNTEPQNQTITSKTQAVITHEGDKWYIQDKSELKTTFIHANHKQELHSGDIILLGNRKFRFEDKQK